jgi:hypothetical protein
LLLDMHGKRKTPAVAAAGVFRTQHSICTGSFPS